MKKIFLLVLLMVLGIGPPMLKLRWVKEAGAVEKVTIESKKCARHDVPDTPARVFVDDLGRIQMVAGQTETWRWVGNNLDEVEKDCGQVVFKSDKDPDWLMFNDYEWLASTYALGGGRIFSLIHNEYHGWDHGNCRYTMSDSDWWKCWYNSISGGMSVDNGLSYTHIGPPNQMLLRSPLDYDKNNASGSFRGFFEPSNIVKKDNYYYVLVNSLNNGGKDGACLMRTRDVVDAREWRLWNGTGFLLELKDAGKCEPVILRRPPRFPGEVVPNPHYLLVYNDYLGKYVSNECSSVLGCFYTTSVDLINWEGLQTMFNKEGRNYCGYATLIQPGDESRNFEVSSRSPWMYFSSNGNRSSCDMGTGGVDEALYRVRLRFNKDGDIGKYELLDLRFSERLGQKALDSSFYGNNGRLSGGAKFGIEGEKSFVSFNGDGVVEVADDRSLDVKGSFTIQAEFRIKNVGKGKFPTILRKEMVGKRNYGLYLTDGGKLHFSFQNERGEIIGSEGRTNLIDGGWHKVAVVVDMEKKTVTYVVDGQSEGMSNLPDLLIEGHNSVSVMIGDQGLVGDIDGVKLLNYADYSWIDSKIVTGDMNNDGVVGLVDLLLWKREYLAGKATLEGLLAWKEGYKK